MTKVKLPKEVAEAIELYLWEKSGDKSRLLKAHGDNDRWWGCFAPLNTIDIMTLASALVNGYEVEQTPEERVREYYDEFDVLYKKFSLQYDVGVVNGIRKTLNLLGITVKGVNAND